MIASRHSPLEFPVPIRVVLFRQYNSFQLQARARGTLSENASPDQSSMMMTPAYDDCLLAITCQLQSLWNDSQ